MDIYDLALALTPRVGNVAIQHLLECFKTAENTFAQSVDQLRQRAELSADLAMAIASHEGIERAKAQIRHCQEHNIAIICASDECYPDALRDLHNAPYVLYVQGNVDLLAHNLVAMVGTRKISSYGQRCCLELVNQIGKTIDKSVIVSGLAYGVDAACHRAAIDCGVPTIAVVPTALPDIAPPQHRNLAREILDSGGALVSEVRAGVSTGANGFIARNRIIAGLARVSIIVESAAKGGAMTTAKIALSNNRAVGAVPGRIFDSASAGCNALLRNERVFAMTSVHDLVRELDWGDRLCGASEDEGAAAAALDGLSEMELRVLQCFESGEAHHISQLETSSGMDASTLASTLMMLELAGHVRALPGSKYERLSTL